jgi:DNA invertase Pin-like site-specific DNA recombinase
MRQAALTTAQPVRADVLGYVSAQAPRGEHLHEEFRSQEEAIASECESRGLRLLRVVHELVPRHRRAVERPGLAYALGRIAVGEAAGLIVSEFARVTRSVPDLGEVLEWFAGNRARFVAASAGIDTAEETGVLVTQAIIQLSRYERQRFTDRTRNGMCAARRNGPASVSDYPELTARIARMRAEGMTLQAIADQLNAEGTPTVRGGLKWRPSSVQAAAGYERPARHQDLGVNVPARGGWL